ncbi:MAG TPA: hypothetical protein VMG60_14650 [Burkholderiaceae bacterium]|nr:hypothetical protein [Burkholderiaceae bacterium]
MKHSFRHGPRLTQREYEQAVVELHSGAFAKNERNDAFIGRRELDLNIDYRLGTAFPSERRDELWRIQRRIEKRRLRLSICWLAGRLVPRTFLARRANRVARFVVDEYAKALTPDELEAYFGADEVASPSLPVDGP